ncbi:MAG: hypothetical protein KDA57_13985 [Planctomycetales bacterium]|nr:hypothetical protein [Planctomycetales bacterium]
MENQKFSAALAVAIGLVMAAFEHSKREENAGSIEGTDLANESEAGVETVNNWLDANREEGANVPDPLFLEPLRVGYFLLTSANSRILDKLDEEDKARLCLAQLCISNAIAQRHQDAMRRRMQELLGGLFGDTEAEAEAGNGGTHGVHVL